MILSCNNINKSFVGKQVLTNVSFHVNEGEKTAIIGVNGAGKSTLLKIIIGEISADSGDITFAKGATIGYLAQHQALTSHHSIYEELLEVKKDVIELYDRMRSLELDMKEATGDELESMLSTYARLNHEFELQNGYAYQSEITGILKGLGFTEEDFQKSIDKLSGGQKTRVALGKLLLTAPDIIFLDEPTNHLDMESIAWLENYLLNYRGAVVIVAHDRYFLDKIVTKVVEIEYTKSQMYLGNYSDFAEKKALVRDAQLKNYLNQQKEIKHQEEVIAKLRSFNREKSIKRAESREKMLNKIERVEKPLMEQHHISIKLEPHNISGNDVLTVKGLSKAFGPKKLFSDLDFEIKREEKVAIIGNNGTGKTTILKILNGLLDADAGEMRLGSKVKIGYYDQEHQVLSPDKTIFDELQDTYPNLSNTAVRNILAAFLFTNDDVFKRIKELSGGERGRVSLAKLMLSEANFLILDEPTNHLDIASKEILEDAINSYSGTVLYVSHDRYFINKTATRILDLTNNKLLNYIGNYDYYLEKKPEVERMYLGANSINVASSKAVSSTSTGKTTTPSTGTTSVQTASVTDASDTKLDWKQQKEQQAKERKRQNELKKVEDEISACETRNDEIDNLLTLEEVYTDVSRLMELNNEKKEIEERLEKLMEKWEELSM
jgi:ATP-binding cassette, subfamily F, member 3